MQAGFFETLNYEPTFSRKGGEQRRHNGSFSSRRVLYEASEQLHCSVHHIYPAEADVGAEIVATHNSYFKMSCLLFDWAGRLFF